MEHKLHATRLQSEVSLLTQEKVAAEESVEALLEEISEFEQGVAQLEKEMHQLSKIEAEAVGVLDEEAKYELREQKMRLDREFGAMLAKIAERREKLGGLEGKLATLDHARQGKEPCINQILAARLRSRWIMASTPSTRHLLDGVEVLVPHRSTEPARPCSRRSEELLVPPTHWLIYAQARRNS